MKQFDYIIVGSGLAGLNSALWASRKGSVLLVTKKKLAASNTSWAQGGIATAWSEKDSFQQHKADTLKAGCYHNNRKAVEFIIKKGPSAIQWLDSLGVAFDREKRDFSAQRENFSLHREGGHSHHRIIHVGDQSGKAIEEKLIEAVRKKTSITLWENAFATDLLVKGKTCYGIQIFRKKRLENIFGKKIILATGGLGELYEKTTNPEVATGDGIAMAWRGGCKLEDLEFIQFHPTALAEKRHALFLLSEALRGAGAQLLNHQKKRFMPNYHPDAELAPRDVVSRAIFQEQKKGSVYLFFGKKSIAREFPSISSYLKTIGLNLEQDLIPVTPAAHFSCGGIKTNLKGETNLKHLYAFGEVACTGLHGANRLASNSLLEAAVMSMQILNTPLPAIQKYPHFESLKYQKISERERKKLKKTRHHLQKVMWKEVGIVRTQKGLASALKTLEKLLLSLPAKIHPEVIEVKNMLQTAILITKAALKRKKSLGTHYLLPKKIAMSKIKSFHF